MAYPLLYIDKVKDNKQAFEAKVRDIAQPRNVNNKGRYTLYGLSSTEEPDRIRYIGLTKRTLRVRLVEHKNEPNRKVNRNKRSCWIKNLINNGKDIHIVSIDECIGLKNANDLEKQYIILFKSFGANLVNGTDGGGGTFGHTVSDKMKEIVSKSNKSRIVSNDTRKKMSIDRMGHLVSDKTRDILREKFKGKKYTEEQKKRLNKTRLDRGIHSWAKGTKGVIKHSEETRNKISKSLTGRKHSEETKRKITELRQERLTMIF